MSSFYRWTVRLCAVLLLVALIFRAELRADSASAFGGARCG